MDPSYNNSFGTQPPASSGFQPPVSSGTGDIVLQPDKSRKSRKGIIIGIVVLLVLLVVALIGYFATGGGKGSGGGSSSDNVSVETAFNRYANYLVSGEVKNDEVSLTDETEFNFTDSYTDDAVLKKATDLYNNFYNKASVDENLVIRSSLSLERGKQYYQLLSEKKTIEMIDTDTLYYKYVDSGAGAALNYAKDFYGIGEQSTDAVSMYRQSLYDLAKIRVDYWTVYSNNGCIVDREYDKTCIESLPYEETEEVSTKLGEASTYIENLDKTIVDRLTKQCVEIANELNVVEKESE